MKSRILLKNALFFVNKNPLSKILYARTIENRSRMPPTEIVSLSKHIQVFSPFTNEINPANDWYGHAKHFKNYLKLPQDYQFKFIIEHGSYPTEQVSEAELEPNLPYFITSNKYRVGVLKKYRDMAFSIGPYIHYVPTFYSQEKMIAEKERLGKNILVFPAHSLSFIIQNYDNMWFIKNIKRLAKNFNSVRICLYWSDIQMGIHKYFTNLGFECVTAGHILDPNFLPRLKTIIESADLTISNDVGTHIGYCVYLNKPHIIFHKTPRVRTNKRWVEFTKEYWSSLPYQEILHEFTGTSFSITKRQRQVSNRYFGGESDIKTPDTFMKIVALSEKTYREGRFSIT